MRRLPHSLLLAIAAFASIASACGDDSPVDAGMDTGPDAADTGLVVDSGVDAAPDAGPPPPALCAPCRRDTDCADDALCLVLEDGERACGIPCTEDADCDGATLPSTCEEEIPGSPRQCTPTAGTCVTVPVGAACATDADCGGRFDRCIDADGLGGRCTGGCAVDADCPVGAHRCGEVGGAWVCLHDELPAAERCAELVTAGLAKTCASDAECDSGRCLLAADGAGVCAVAGPCDAGPEVAPGLCAPSAPTSGPTGPADAIVADCSCYASAVPGSLFDEAIGELDRTRCDMHWPSAVMNLIDPRIAHDPFRLSFTDHVLGEWSSAVPFAEAVDASLDEGGVAGSIAAAAAWTDLVIAEPTPYASDDLADALATLLEATGATPDRAGIATQVDALSPDLARRLAPIVVAVREARLARDAAVARLGDDIDRYFDGPSGVFLGGFLNTLDLRRSEHLGALRGDVDVRAMAEAAARLAATVEAARLDEVRADAGELTLITGWGRVAVRGGDAHTYEADTWDETLLLVDLGGDDVYRMAAGATTSARHGVSLVIDVRGADTYGYDEVPHPEDDGPVGHTRLPSDAGRRETARGSSLSAVSRQGAGRLGIGMLFDLGDGSDTYRSLRMSQGYGALGVGVLFDGGGDDFYHAEAASQGAAAFGIGLLIEAGGNDRYTAYRMAQGFAYARAFGGLWDGAGDDTYFLHPSDVLYPSSQDSAGSNASLGQGAGFGRRADFIPDRVFMSGGLGVLRDVSGADDYTCAIFGQASGFWYGTGLLSDGDGDDHYDGQWYVQSGSAHFALSVLLEGGGNDVYNMEARRQNVTNGGGHDFSLAVFLEKGGDDTYLAPGLSFGAGNAAGTGFFGDASGTDSYDATRNLSMGNASIETEGDLLRRMGRTVGVFLDADGLDTHTRPEPMPVENDSTWRQRWHADELSEEGVGIDRAGAVLGL